MKAKLSIVVFEAYGNDLVQEEDNSVNGIDEMDSMLWDIIVSWESKHIWKMVKET
jgi:hypothetical protein